MTSWLHQNVFGGGTIFFCIPAQMEACVISQISGSVELLPTSAVDYLEKPGHDFWTEAEASFMSELRLLPEVHTRTLGGGL